MTRLRTRINIITTGKDEKVYVLERYMGILLGWREVMPRRSHVWQVHGDAEQYIREYNEGQSKSK
jgi:hypothetical protein